MNAPVAIIIVTYNSAAEIGNTLDVVLQSIDAGMARCIVVDNGSSDNTLEILKQYDTSIETIESTNRGFAAGCNLGIDASDNDYVLLLNPDSRLARTELQKMIDFMDANPVVGVAAPAILENGEHWQPVGGRTTPATVLNEALGRENQDKIEAPHGAAPFRTSWVCGAIFMIRREILTRTGQFDETYFMYFEETDFCHQVERHGGEIWCVASAIGYHVGGASSSQGDDIVHGCISRFYFPSRIHYLAKIYGVTAAYLTLGAEAILVSIRVLLKLLIHFRLDRESWRYAKFLYRYYPLWN